MKKEEKKRREEGGGGGIYTPRVEVHGNCTRTTRELHEKCMRSARKYVRTWGVLGETPHFPTSPLQLFTR